MPISTAAGFYGASLCSSVREMSTAQESGPGTVTRSWARIDVWLAAHAPESVSSLNGPADPAGIAEAERAMTLQLPADLVESLRCHNGATEDALARGASVLPGADLLSASEIARTRRMVMENAKLFDAFEQNEGEDEPYWHSLWIPWANREHPHQVVDMRPGPQQGRLGSAWGRPGNFSPGGDGCWSSLAAYLEAVADALYSGGDVGGWRAHLKEDKDELVWELELDSEPLGEVGLGPGADNLDHLDHLDSFRQLRPAPIGLP
ncbi:SMI1/KNR4 family protein [Streptomyces sp. NPDC088141]|uniref:SMI1/KNR4 family protein n=1 Tax=Streptomyces sp. NPDC088141 TaxID=3155179 RepID=UPI0034184DC5